jgi:hypothetical protein
LAADVRDLELHLVVLARITAMKKFALTNSSNPGSIVYMIIRDEVGQRLQGVERTTLSAALSSSEMIAALNQKTASIGLAIRSVFVDTVVKNTRFGAASHGHPKRFHPSNRFQKPLHDFPAGSMMDSSDDTIKTDCWTMVPISPTKATEHSKP